MKMNVTEKELLKSGAAKSDAEMGDYIASFLSHGFWKPDTSTAGGNYGCSTVAVTSPDGAPLFGRNFDWEECDKMLVHTVPKNGYASIATCNLDFLGFGEDWKPDGSMGDKFMALASVAQSNFPGENGGEKTCWSLVYDQRELTAALYDTEDWAHPYVLSLGQKDWCKKGE